MRFGLILAAVVSLALSACGGGGGGGETGGQSASISLSAQTMTFVAASTADTVPPQTVTATVTTSGVSGATLYLLISWTGNAVGNVSDVTITSTTTGSATVTPASPAALGPGTHTSTITVVACLNDPTCATGQLTGSPMTINVVYQIGGFAISPTSVTLNAVEGQSPATLDLTLSRAFSPTIGWTTSTTIEGNTIPWLSVSPSAASSTPALLKFSASPMVAGSYYATTTIVGADGLSLPIPVNYIVVPKIALGATAATFSTVAGQASLPVAGTISATAPGGEPGYWTAIYYTAGGATGWLDLTGSSLPGTLTIAPNTTNLAPGTYRATVQLNPAGGGTAVNVDVSYTVSAGVLTASPGAVSWTTIAGSGQTVSQQLAFASNFGAASWTSAVVYDSGPSGGWLTVPASGDTNAGAAISANTAGLATGTYRAHITFSAANSTVVVPVTLAVKAAGVYFVSSYVGTSGVAGNVVIRGLGLSGAAQVKFGSNAASTFAVVNDTEIRAGYPPLAAGTYAVTVDGLGTRANLVVVDAPAFSYATVARPGGATAVRTLLYDAERRAVYLVQDNWSAADRLERFRFSAGSWVADAPLMGSGFDAYDHNLNSTIVLAPDGLEILKTNRTSISHVSTSSFLETATVSAYGAFGSSAALNFLAMGNDGKAVGNAFADPAPGTAALYRYDVLDRQFSSLAMPAGLTDPMNRMLQSSADGSRILLASIGGLSAPVYQYSAGDGALTGTPVSAGSAQHVALSRNGAVSIIETATDVHSVYDASFNLLGNLPSLTQCALSPDGRKIYAYVAGTPGMIHVYDTNAPSSGSFNEIGTGTALVDSPGNGVQMVVTPDGGSLIIAGNQRVVVMPAP
jgi:hypothetical protein